MMDKCNEDFNEIGVLLESNTMLGSNFNPTKSKRFNHKLKIYREFALATLSTLAMEKRSNTAYSEKEENPSYFYALDAYSCTGLAALQWKKHLQHNVHVTAADHSDVCVIQQNAKKNSMMCSPWQLDPIRVPGDPKSSQAKNEIFCCQADAKTVMSMETFHFIYLNPYKNSSVCLDSAFHSLNSGGVLSLVVPDLSIFARAPHVVRRTFSAQVIKTEYLKEMAARTVLAEAARAAAKYSKGILALYVVSQDDYLLITLQVHRGQKAVDWSLNNVCQLLHCRFCEERVFIANQLAPHDNLYDLLPCACRSKNVGKTAVILGPMWKGCIFNTAFLTSMVNEGSKLKLSAKFCDMASLLLTESMCSSGEIKVTSDSQQTALSPTITSYGNHQSDIEKSENKLSNEKIMTLPDALPAASKDIPKSSDDNGNRKRKASFTQGESPAKSRRKDFLEDAEQPNVPFYYNVSRSKKGVSLKLNKLVTLLQTNNHCASRTHFDPCAIRTSATVQQFVELLD